MLSINLVEKNVTTTHQFVPLNPLINMNLYANKRISLKLLLIVLLSLIPLIPIHSQAQQKSIKKVENPVFVFNNAFNSRGTSYTEIANVLSDLGYNGIEHREVEGIFELKEKMNNKGMKIYADYLKIDLDAEQPYLEEWKEAIPKLAGTDLVLWTHIHSKKFKPSDTKADKLIVPIVQELADLAKPYGIKVAIYPHFDLVVETAVHSSRLAQKIDRENVGAVFNLVHFLSEPGNPNLEATIKEIAPQLIIASISGGDKSDNFKQMPMQKKVRPVGVGTYDVYNTVKLLLDNGYKGPIGFQCYLIEGEPKDFLKTSIESWKHYVQLYESGVNTISKQEQKEGWQLLFDGVSSNGWRGITKENFPQNGWEVMAGELRVNAVNGEESANGGDIVTTEKYGPDFEMKWEWKMYTVGGNSGVKYFVQEENTHKGSYSSGYGYGLEYQILDDANHPWMKEGKMTPNDYHTIGSLYEFFPAASTKKVMPLGKWNTSRIVSKDNQVEHWLNGEKILSYERGGKQFMKMLKKSKFKDVEGFGQEKNGHILLQDHGSKVYYRNIKIRQL